MEITKYYINRVCLSNQGQFRHENIEHDASCRNYFNSHQTASLFPEKET